VERVAPPTAGVWRAGSIVFNRKAWDSNVSTTQQPVGWVCVTPGRPGVWANLSLTEPSEGRQVEASSRLMMLKSDDPFIPMTPGRELQAQIDTTTTQVVAALRPEEGGDDGDVRTPTVQLQFGPPVILHGAANVSFGSEGRQIILDGNQSSPDSFFALDDRHIFGQYENSYNGPTPVIFSNDSGRSWQFSTQLSGSAINGVYREQSLMGKGSRPAKLLRTFGLLLNHSRPGTSFSSSGFAEFSVSKTGKLNVTVVKGQGGNAITFGPLPRPTSKNCGFKAGFYEPVASTVLPDDSLLCATIVCFADSPLVARSRFGNISGTGWNRTASSLVAWRSVNGGLHWTYRGLISDAAAYMQHNISSMGNTEENDLAVMADGKTVMAVMRTDGDCDCKASFGAYLGGPCGIYRPYYQAYSSDQGSTWSLGRPIPGTGCARPRLLSLGVGKPMLMSGGRMCSSNMTGLFVWLNRLGLPYAPWEIFSLSYQHNKHWQGDPTFLFDERVNASNFFETQAYASLVQVGDNEAFVTYNKYLDPIFNGWPGCWTWEPVGKPRPRPYCSVGFGMRITIKTDDSIENHLTLKVGWALDSMLSRATTPLTHPGR